jgi:hypothetical protein
MGQQGLSHGIPMKTVMDCEKEISKNKRHKAESSRGYSPQYFPELTTVDLLQIHCPKKDLELAKSSLVITSTPETAILAIKWLKHSG